MVERRSSSRRVAPTLALLVVFVAGWAAPVEAQEDDLAAVCAAETGASQEECSLAAGTARVIHPRVGLALFGGSPVPGSASTLGMRLGSLPRVSFSGRVVALPMELPPLADRSVQSSLRATAVALSGQATVGILSGWSPLPTVGGFLSLDATARLSWSALPSDRGFQDGSVLGGALALRLGLLRESFTLPGVSITGTYGRTGRVSYGDPRGAGDGFVSGAVSMLGATAAATKRVGPVGVTLGASVDRYGGDVDIGYPGAPAGGRSTNAATTRWSGFGNLSWTFLIFHASLEGGWQEAPAPDGIPASVTLDPTGWWGGLAFRLSI